MEKLDYHFSVYLPRSLAQTLRNAKQKADSRKKNLLGDRDIEWSFIAGNLPQGTGRALDVGSGGSYLALMAAERGFEVTATDLGPVHWYYEHPKLQFVQGDIFKMNFPRESFDLILNCSTVEHAGIMGRYGVSNADTDGDLKMMKTLYDWMKPGAQMLLTIPIGKDQVFVPLCRVYGQTRLPKLLAGFTVLKEEFWMKNGTNRWQLSSRTEATKLQASAGSWDTNKNLYALGCFVLKKNG